MNQEPTPDELQQLVSLIEEATAVGQSATEFSAKRLRVCVDVGRMLNGWKQRIPKGKWSDWTKQHLPAELKERSRQMWMKLADKEAEGNLDLSSARGLRQAYQMAGLLPESGGTGTKATAAPTSYLTHLARLTAALEAIDVDTLTNEEKATLKQRFEPVSQFVRKL